MSQLFCWIYGVTIAMWTRGVRGKMDAEAGKFNSSDSFQESFPDSDGQLEVLMIA